MAQQIQITDPADPRLADYVSLRDSQLRLGLEAERGLFIAEGAKIIERAGAAGYRARSFLLAPRWLDGLAPVLEASDAPCYLLSEAAIEQVTGFHVHRGALASMWRRPGPSVADLMGHRRLVVCEDIVDHTNIGAIIRDAAGLGWDGVLLAPRAADPLYRRAIKTSMGTVFSLPWARLDDWESGLDQLRQAGFRVVALALGPDAVSLADMSARLTRTPAKVALLLGTEGDGLSATWLAKADDVVQIPMSRGVDSLNVAAAAAIACYVLGPAGSLGCLGEIGQSSG